MKRHLLLFILLLTLGVGWSKAQNTNVGSGPYEFTLGTGTGTVNYLPLRNSVQYTLSQQLYLASEIVEAGMTNKPVGSISFYSVGNVGCNLKGTKIWMANVSGSAVSTTSPLASGMTLVYDGEQIQVDGWNEFQLNGDFAWDGTSNILVLFQSNRGSTGSDIYWQYTTDLGFNASAFATGFYNPFNPEGATYNMGTPYNYRVNTKFKSFVGIPCPKGLKVSDVTTNSANLSWTARGGETGWNVRYRVSGDENAWTEVTGLNADVTSYSITGLQENTTYEVQLSSVLGEEVSNWTSSFTFRTYLGVTIPDVATFVTFRDGINSGTSFTLSDMTIPAGGETVMFILGDNLDLSSVCGPDVNGGTSWTPIGNTNSNPFKGAFDGNGKTISGLYVNSDDGNNKGLFGYVTNGSIQNLTLEGSINASCSYIGSVCAYLTNGTISGCCNKVQIMASASFGYTNVGGICGWGTKSIITNCVNEGTLEGMYVGGICCNNNNGFISNCSNKADLHARFGAGVCYQNYSGSEISYCYNTGNLSSSATGSESVCLTGIVNQNEGAVSHCFNLGDLSATQTTNSALCGLSDVNNGSIANCYNMGLLAGYVVYGGVRSFGYASTTANCYSAGTLKGIYSSYGFSNSSSGTNCYFDNQMTLASDAYGTGKSTALMTSGSLFSDAGNWVESEGLYPRINGLETTEAALVAASPVLLETSEIYNNVESTFTLGRADDDIVWTADNDLVTIGDGGICTINGIGDVTLTCALDDVSRNVTLHVFRIPWEGEGTESSPYLITSKADMENLAGIVNDGTDYQGVYFKVTSDIDLECDASHPWTPIGNNTNSFKGYFDGNNHVISNMVITNANGQYQGLFGCTTNAEISNLTVAGSMTGDDYTAGVVGCMFGGRVYNCINNVTCSAGNFIAGICGTLKENGILENCINAADLTAAQPGGICQNCNDNSQILNCRNDGDITKTGTNEDYGAGGICQINYGTISNCCNTGSVSGNNYVGGICGYNYNKIEKCYNLGLVEGNQWVGGICGYEEYNGYRNCYVEYCVNVGEVHANYNYGGVVGTMKGRSNSYRACCTNCINIAPVIGIPDNTNTGGVIGQFYNSYYTVNNCYYDKQMCTIEDNSWGYPHGVSVSTAEMTSGNLFDNDNWVETSGLYPRIAGMENTDAALVAASPVFLGGFDASFVMGGFSVGKADEDVVWTASNNLVSIGDDGTCTINGSGDVTLTCTLNGISKSMNLHVEESPWEGAGTQDNPYEISNAQELSALSSMVDEGMSFKDTYFIMTADIDLSTVCGAGIGEDDEDVSWMPIGGYYYDYEEGYKESYFSGHFDGGFHTVSNLYINDPENDYIYAGLFGTVDCGSICNLAVTGYVYGGEKSAGICAHLTGGTISRCHNAVTVHNNYTAGGIVAHFENSENTEESHIGTITDCYNTGAVTGSYNAGGICGNLSNSQLWNEDLEDYEFTCRILNCYNSGLVSGSSTGAICPGSGFVDKGGDRSESSNVVNCYYDKQMSLASDNNATGLLTSQMTTSNQLFGNDNANWVYENGLYPRLTDMDDSDVAVLHATPIFLNGDETVASVFSDFNVSVLPENIGWLSSNATEGLTVTIAQIAADGLKGVSFEGTGSFNLTAALGSASRTVNLRIPYVFEITSAAQLAHLSYILSNEVEWSDDGYPWVDANGVPLEDGHLVPPYAFDTYFKLMNDISLAAICGEGVGNWRPIGYDGFMGHFNGNGHTISDLYINDEESANQALFGGVDDGSISNLTVEGSVKAESYVAGICVYLRNNGTLTNCHNAVALSASGEYSYAGGVCVENYGTISNCSNSAHLEAFNVGGVCQENRGRIDHCYNAGTIEGSYIGGICSYNNDGTTISNCYNVGTLTGTEEVYGIAYNGWSALITDCFNAGTLAGNRVYGIGYGYDDSYFTNCYNTGALFGDEYVAAICNSAEDGGGSGPSKGNNNVTNCFYDKQICTATNADATGLLTSEMTSGNSIFGAGNSNWVYTENFYPLLTGMNETDAAQVAAEPLFLSATDNAGSVIGSFSVNGTSGITWTAATDPSDILDVDGNTYTFTAEGEAVMTCSKNGIEKAVSLYHPEVKVITTAAQLAELATGVNSGVGFSITGLGSFPAGGEGVYFVLGNDIDLNGSAENQWTPIGSMDVETWIPIPFRGHFDGDGNTISGLYVDSENNYQGLFGYVASGSILNLTVEGEVHSGEYEIGGICGWSDYATFKNCVSNVEVTGIEDVAGICGGSRNITIENCVNNGNVNGAQYLGGIVGYASGDNIVKNCANNAPVVAEQPENEEDWGYDVGGICGCVKGTVSNSYNAGMVVGNYDCGPICGYVKGTVSNSYNAGMVVGNYDCGPICGKIYGTITNCYFDTDMCSGFESYVADGVSGAPSSDFTSGILPYGFDSDVWYAVPGSYPRLIDNDHVMALPVMAYEEEGAVRDGEPFGGWYLVASPMTGDITPSVNNGLLNDPEGADFDLYGFNIRESGEEWCNVKDESNEIVVMNGKGYLVANGKNTVVRFTGDFHAEEEVVVSGISGWGLVGNPLGTVATVSCDFYKMNANHSELVLCEAGTTVNPGEAIFVNSSSVTFTPANASAPVSSPMLNLNLSNAENGLIDRASIRFGEGKSLDKFMLDEANTQLYMPQGEKRYAVVATNAKAGEMPVNFKAEKQGNYTLSVEMKDVTPGSLRLIDKLTGADIDLLATPSYTFMASPSDSAERFTVVIR